MILVGIDSSAPSREVAFARTIDAGVAVTATLREGNPMWELTTAAEVHAWAGVRLAPTVVVHASTEPARGISESIPERTPV